MNEEEIVLIYAAYGTFQMLQYVQRSLIINTLLTRYKLKKKLHDIFIRISNIINIFMQLYKSFFFLFLNRYYCPFRPFLILL